MRKSIIQSTKECYLCRATRNLHKHHCIHGTANRQLADRDGLFVFLCADCHRDLHDKGIGDRELKAIAQIAWCERYGPPEAFRKRYGKIYL